MKLTKEQIEEIDHILRKHYTFENFDDLRIELVDHIASDTELLMQNENRSFNEALPDILYKWKTEISWDRHSRHNSVPKMVSCLWRELDWKYNSITIAIVVLLFVVSQFFRKEEWTTFAMYVIGLVGCFLGIYLISLFKKNRFNTVLSMYAEDRLVVNFIMVFIGIVANAVINYFDGDFLSQPGFPAIIYATITLMIKTILMRKNIKIENQLLKVL